MPNLVGVYDSKADETSLRSVLRRMITIVDIPEYSYLKKKAQGRHLHCGNVLTGIEDNESQPVYDLSKNVWLMLDGEILGREPLEQELQSFGVDAANLDDAELALCAYLHLGENFLKNLNGRWNIVIHHVAEDLTIIASDRYGSRLLYWAKDGDRFVFGSELKAVITARPHQSLAGGYGLLELFMGPYLHGDRTWVDGIKVLNPGTFLRLQRGQIQLRRYWKASFNEGQVSVDEDNAVFEFKERLATAVRRNLRRKPNHPLAITLSGGLDSRSLALSIPEEQRPISALTYGDEHTPDVMYARQLADVLGLNFNHVESQRELLFDKSREVLRDLRANTDNTPYGFYSSQIDRVTWRDEFFGDQTGVTSMIWHPLYSKHMNLMLQGACGDALTGSHLTLFEMGQASRRQLIEKLMNTQYFQPIERLSQVFSKSFIKQYWPQRVEKFSELFENIDADNTTAISNVWDMENRQRRGAFSTFTMERYFCQIRVPYLDYELANFLSHLPPKLRFQQRLYKQMIVNGYPEASHVPWAYTRRPIGTKWKTEFAKEWYNYWSRKIRSKISPKSSSLPIYAFRDNQRLLQEDKPFGEPVYRWLQSDRFDSDVFNPEGIR
ncbi:MAG: asparagine synthase-related protein, partial [Myxococcota bacterium]|nr:asparagine synthase-related protein [Myxococcota bacterium]